jgi:hypothetical protein
MAIGERAVRVGFAVPRRVGGPSGPCPPPDHRAMLGYARLADGLGFDSVMGWTPARVRDQYVVGTPDEVIDRLLLAAEWGVAHLICTLGVRMYTFWSDGMLELFAHEVLPRLSGSAARSSTRAAPS